MTDRLYHQMTDRADNIVSKRCQISLIRLQLRRQKKGAFPRQNRSWMSHRLQYSRLHSLAPNASLFFIGPWQKQNRSLKLCQRVRAIHSKTWHWATHGDAVKDVNKTRAQLFANKLCLQTKVLGSLPELLQKWWTSSQPHFWMTEPFEDASLIPIVTLDLFQRVWNVSPATKSQRNMFRWWGKTLYIYIYSLLLVHVKKGLTTYRSVFGLLYTVSQLYFFGTRVVRWSPCKHRSLIMLM